MKVPKTLFIITFFLYAASVNAMDLEKDTPSIPPVPPPTLLEQLKTSATQYENIDETKELIKQIKNLKKSKATKTIKDFSHWLHGQLQDNRNGVLNGKYHYKFATGEIVLMFLTFNFSYLGLFGEPMAILFLGIFANVLFFTWIASTVQTFKYLNQAEPIVIHNDDIRRTLLALDKVKLKKSKKVSKKKK